MLIYQCSPLDRADNTTKALVEGEIEYIMSKLWDVLSPKQPLSIFRPGRAFMVHRDLLCDRGEVDLGVAIVRINMFAVQQADAVLAVYVAGVETWGCPMELFLAASEGVPIVVCQVDALASNSPLPLYLLALGGVQISKNANEAVHLLAEIAKGGPRE